MPSFPRTYEGTLNEREKVTSDTDEIVGNAGFMVNLDGTLSYRLRNESALVTDALLAGHFYPFDIEQVDITGSTTVTAVTIFRRAPA